MVPTPKATKALTDALALALSAYPDEQATILRGFTIALNGGVIPATDGVSKVRSDSRPGEYYHCNGACTCRAFSRAPGGRCKHRYSVALANKAHTLLEQKKDNASKTPQDALQGTDDCAMPASLAAEICNPTRRVARELAGFSGPTARHR